MKSSRNSSARSYLSDLHAWHATVRRCSLLRADPAQHSRIEEIHSNLLARIAEAEREGWQGEVEGLKVSLAGAEQKLAQLDWRARCGAVHSALRPFRDIAGRTVTAPQER